MATFNGFEANRRKNRAGALWFAGGTLFGLMLGLVLPRAMGRLNRAQPEAAPTPVASKPRVAIAPKLQIAAVPTQRGLVLSSVLPLKLLQPGESKKAVQQGAKIFCGFRSWSGTSNYLQNGDGVLLLQTKGAVYNTGWKPADIAKVPGGAALTTDVVAGQPFTLAFRRNGQRAIPLATFQLEAKSAVPTPATTPSAAP